MSPSPDPVLATPRWQGLAWLQGLPAEQDVRRLLAPVMDADPGRVGLARDVHGRPRLAAEHGLDVGWSHSGDGLLLAAGRGIQVGIDLERERPRARAMELARRFFAPGEAQWLESQADEAARAAAFVRLWCAKEAVL